MVEKKPHVKEEKEDEVTTYEFAKSSVAPTYEVSSPQLDVLNIQQQHPSMSHDPSLYSPQPGVPVASPNQPAKEYIQYIPDATTQQFAHYGSSTPYASEFESVLSEGAHTQKPFVTRRLSRAISQQTHDISHYNMETPIPQMLNYFSADELEAAIACGRVYGHSDANFISGEAVKRAGMVTLYDSGMIPTFETELDIAFTVSKGVDLVKYKQMLQLDPEEEFASHEIGRDEIIEEISVDDTETKGNGATFQKFMQKLPTGKRNMHWC